jgi:hypothetical protein
MLMVDKNISNTPLINVGGDKNQLEISFGVFKTHTVLHGANLGVFIVKDKEYFDYVEKLILD